MNHLFSPQSEAFKLSLRYAGLGMIAIAASMPDAASAATPIRGSVSNLCMDVRGASTTPGAVVQIASCNGGANQQWEFTPAGELRTFGGTRCLDVQGQRTTPETPVSSYTCNGQDNQKWTFSGDGTIRGRQSGLCLDVVGDGNAVRTPLQIFSCNGGGDQRWTREGTGNADTQRPTQVSGLRMAGLACRSGTLSWAASSDNVGVVAYDIYHDGQQMATVSGSTLSASLTLTPGARWGIYVNARDAAGLISTSSASLDVSVPQCTSDTQAPSVPTGLSGSAAGTTVTLRWSASSDNVGVTAYDIYRNDTKVGNTANLSFTDSGLSANTAYRYAVAARDAQSNVSARSVSLSVATGGSCSGAVCSVREVAGDRDIPWGVITLPDGNVIYGRRDAKDLVRLNPTNGSKTTIGQVPNVELTDGEGGLLGLAVTPNFPATDPWIYIYHTSARDNRIVRIRYVNGSLDTGSLQVLLSGIGRSKYHNGGRLRFGPDGKLYATAGDAENSANAQDRNNLAGKVLRLNADGSRPSDNPFGNYVWSYGHRNPQGLAFDSQGRLWAQEFGNSLQDETNLIQKGGNYGWPDCEGTVSKGGNGCGTAGFIAPKYTYSTGNASCSGIAIVRDRLYVACLRGQRVYRHVISGSSLTNVQELFSGTYGRIRTVEPTIDGGLWMSTSNSGDKDSIANNSNEKIYKVILGN